LPVSSERRPDPVALSRRTLLGAAGLGGITVASGLGASQLRSEDSGAVEFSGQHQAGILTAVQDHLHFVSLDVTTSKRTELVALLKEWTAAARQMTAGAEVGPSGAAGGAPLSPPDDTGEALGLKASRLTVTIGFGPRLFERFGLEQDRPDALRELPAFSGDRLDPALCGGDIAIQACADDPQVAVHAVRNLIRIGFGRTSVRWSQLGFGRTSSTTAAQVTSRNLLGFKDGTRNIKAEDRDDLSDFVWASAEDGPRWMVGGSYLVARKITMRIEQWDRESLEGQEEIIGRLKGSGAPHGAHGEFDPIIREHPPALNLGLIGRFGKALEHFPRLFACRLPRQRERFASERVARRPLCEPPGGGAGKIGRTPGHASNVVGL